MTEEMDELVGERVVDPEDIEIGYIDDYTDGYFILREGFMEHFMLHRDLVTVGADGSVRLKESVYNTLYGDEVFDSESHFVGTVVELTETEDVLDTIIIDRLENREEGDWDPDEDRHLYLLPEEIHIIRAGRIDLMHTYEDLKFHNHPHTVRSSIWDRVQHLFRDEL